MRAVQTVLTPIATAFSVLMMAGGGALMANPRSFQLVAILNETKALISRSTTDLSHADWADAEEALREIDFHIAKLHNGELDGLPRLRLLFAPTGQLQDVSIDSGWGEEFRELAARFDAAVEGIQN